MDGEPTIDVTGWNSTASFLGVATPNWVSFAAALLLALWSWFDADLARKRWPQALALLLVVHALDLGGVMLASSGSQVGLGLVVSLATWLAVLVALRRAGRVPRTPDAATATGS